MQVCKYASKHIYASMQVCKYASMKVCMYRATDSVRSRLLPELLNTVSKVQPTCALLTMPPPPPSILVTIPHSSQFLKSTISAEYLYFQSLVL